MSTETLSALEARRIALAAQGFADPKPKAEPGRAHLKRVFDRVGLIQIDSVNVITRSHYLPPFARLGPYPQSVLEDAAWGKRKILFEYWGHEASLIPMQMQPLFRWRMAEAREGRGLWGGVHRFGVERADFVRQVLKEIEKRGPIGAGALEEAGKAKGGWWGWSDGKRAVEWLFWAGLVTTSTRKGFERLYDIPERALPRAIVDTPTPTPEDAQRELIRIASRAMGVATVQDLRDYFRMGVEETKARVGELVEAGELIPTTVKGWDRPAFLHPEAKRPRKVRTAALLSPFDSLVWRRERAERLFGFRYRIEIYVPAHKREHGYYVLPFLLDEKIVGRLDLKSDRQSKRLLVKSAHAEGHADPARIAHSLWEQLNAMAAWLGLDRVEVECGRPLAQELRRLSGA
ncbi:MAG: YcaQ family DNA glycosylase [Proteobacteria bacterium]|nr:YcaQ family DNA glycosylase [Pseudomonadota bacterium]